MTTHAAGEAGVSVPDFLAARKRFSMTPIAAAGAFTPEFALTGFGDPRQLRGRVVSADYFRTLGVPLAQGRDVAREEEKPGAGFVVIITDLETGGSDGVRNNPSRRIILDRLARRGRGVLTNRAVQRQAGSTL